MRIKSPNPASKRYESTIKLGYDVKFAYHVIRLLAEVEQILTHNDLDLEQNREQLKSIRRGEWTLKEVERYASDKERFLEKVYAESKLPAKPRERKIKAILLNCLEEFYGKQEHIARDKYQLAIEEINSVLQKYKV